MLGKIIVSSTLTVRTGLHIGNSDAFSPIGAIDSTVVRDVKTGLPVIPGSSLKGKLRTLLSRSIVKDIQKMPDFDNDDERIKRLFGSSKPIKASRLQFSDSFISNVEEMSRFGFTEVKAENAIDRVSAQANPRFIERVNPGTEFKVCIVYNVENKEEAMEDLQMLAKGMKLLQIDYLGGHGSRGSGRVSFSNFEIEAFESDLNTDEIKDMFTEVDTYELLSV